MRVEFLQDFGGKVKGSNITLAPTLSASLIKKGIVKVYVEKAKKEVKPKEDK